MAGHEPTVLEYARHTGLSTDFTSVSPLHIDIPSKITADFLRDLEQIFPIALPILEHGLSEKWTLSYAAAALLKSVLDPRPQEFQTRSDRRHATQGLRVGPVLMSTDETLQYKRWLYGRTAREHHKVSIDCSSDSEPMSNRLDWPLFNPDLVSSVNSRITQEKLISTKSALTLIRSVIEDKPPAPFNEDVHVPRKRPPLLDLPLLPLSPYLQGNDSVLKAEQVSPASSPLDPSIKYLQDINHGMLASPIAVPPHLKLDEIIDTFNASAGDASFVAALRTPGHSTRKRHHCKVEKMPSPLLPHEELSSPFKRIKITALVGDALESPPTSDDDLQYKHVFEEFINDEAAAVTYRLAHEELETSNTVLRMKIPSIDDGPALAPWLLHKRKHEENPRGLPDVVIVANSLARESVQCHSSKLSWLPVPYVRPAQLLNESIDMNAAGQDLLVCDHIDEECFSWKQPGLRLLDLEDIPEELETAYIDPQDLTFVNFVEQIKPLRSEKALSGSTQPTQPQVDVNEQLAAYNNAGLTDRQGRATDDLDHFFAVQSGGSVRAPVLIPVDPRLQRASPATSPAGASLIPFIAQALRPFNTSSAPAHIIISSTILSDRPLLSSLRSLLPRTQIIERDYTTASEADILATPTTGIILTSLQKLAQRPLPGSSERENSVLTRLRALVARYERVIALVGTPLLQSEVRESDRTNVASLGSAIGALRLVEGVLVPADEMARAVAQWICVSAKRDMGSRQPEGAVRNDHGDEAVEGVLRHSAGLNGFAAMLVADEIREGVEDVHAFLGRARREQGIRDRLRGMIGAKAVARLVRAATEHAVGR